MPLRQSPDVLLILQAAAAAFAAARLLHFGLRGRFPVLFLYLLLSSLSSAVFSVLSERSSVYYWAYLMWQPACWCLGALAVREMFALVFADYPGLRTAGKWALYTALGVSAVAFLLIDRTFRAGSVHSRLLLRELVLDRSVVFGLAVIIVMLLLFLSRFPLHLDRNTYVASACFSAMFLAQAAAKLLDSVSPHLFARYADYSEVGFSAACLITWGVMLRAADARIPVRSPAGSARELELLQQLASLNDILGRSVRG